MARILVVDDDALRTMLKTMLEPLCHSVSVAVDGSQALDQMRASAFDLVLLDLVMPNKGGVETIMELARVAPETPVVIMSGNIRDGDESVNRLVDRFGAKAALPKPFDRERLLAILDQFL